MAETRGDTNAQEGASIRRRTRARGHKHAKAHSREKAPARVHTRAKAHPRAESLILGREPAFAG